MNPPALRLVETPPAVRHPARTAEDMHPSARAIIEALARAAAKREYAAMISRFTSPS